MSTRFESASSERADVGTFFTADTAYACGFWVYFVSFPSGSDSGVFWSLYDNSVFQGWSLAVDSSGVLHAFEHGGENAHTGSTLSTATWYYIWVRRDGTGFFANTRIYLDESTTADIDQIGNLGADPDFLLGDTDAPNFGSENLVAADCRILNVKFWDADSAASNAASESGECEHQTNTGDAYSEYLLDDHTDLTDNGPGTRDLTATGTLSTEADEGSWSCGGADPEGPLVGGKLIRGGILLHGGRLMGR